jgi:hypothetical protein
MRRHAGTVALLFLCCVVGMLAVAARVWKETE